MKLLVASNSPKKRAELDRILQAAGISGVELVSLREVPAYPEPVEDGTSFAENALIKARAGVEHTGLITIADDSGLTVAALRGMPGIFSARWSGHHGDDAANNALLLGQLSDVPEGRRQAAFVSVCALVTPEGQETVVEGRWEGSVLRAEVGENGFGYDPLFHPNEAPEGVSSAQLTPEEKDQFSHRGKALRQLVPAIAELASQHEDG